MGIEKPNSTLSHLNSAFDPEMERYLDLDEASDSKPTAGFSMGSYGESEQIFPGPSFQYDSYKQQTGLPTGGLADTFALNKASGMQYNGFGSNLVMPMDTLNVPLANMDDFDFAAYNGDMDLEPDSPTENSLYSTQSSKGSFVDPNALVGRVSSTSTPVQRMYPGMHSQLAAQAKAQQAQKQAAGQQSRPMPQGQKALPASLKTPVDKDPVVEESISRLLNQMRHGSVGSADDDSGTPTANVPHLARMKKDEDDMDEDERLLASEEGKKLSSKERRQLRNKVSARAFRSRRKEYIGQLEGEVATKVQEANDLMVENRQLMEENSRLTDLTRLLLSSPAFSTFLNELSNSGPPVGKSQASKSQSQPALQLKKDLNPTQAARQMSNQRTTVLTPLPENLKMGSTWAAGVPSGFQVFT